MRRGLLRLVLNALHHRLLLHDHLIQILEQLLQLHERALDLAVSTSALGEAPAADGVDFVHEDDAGLVLFGVAKHLADETGGFANVFVYDG